MIQFHLPVDTVDDDLAAVGRMQPQVRPCRDLNVEVRLATGTARSD
jgi:hypothetical protein